MDAMNQGNSENYRVVINQEQQYSILPSHIKMIPGWFDVGKQGSKEDCLAYIAEVWTDMRPRSLRLVMDRMHQQTAHASPDGAGADCRNGDEAPDDDSDAASKKGGSMR